MNRSGFYMVRQVAVRGMVFKTSRDDSYKAFILAVKFYFFLLTCFKMAKIPALMPSIA